MNAIQHAVALPPDEVVIHRAVRRKILRKIAPLTTGAQDIHQAVYHRTHVGAALAAARSRRRNERRNNGPLLVREVAWVSQMITIGYLGRFFCVHIDGAPNESDRLLRIIKDSTDSRSFKTDTYTHFGDATACCAFCVKPLPIVNGELQPWRAPSGQFFCNEFCADDAEDGRSVSPVARLAGPTGSSVQSTAQTDSTQRFISTATLSDAISLTASNSASRMGDAPRN